MPLPHYSAQPLRKRYPLRFLARFTIPSSPVALAFKPCGSLAGHCYRHLDTIRSVSFLLTNKCLATVLTRRLRLSVTKLHLQNVFFLKCPQRGQRSLSLFSRAERLLWLTWVGLQRTSILSMPIAVTDVADAGEGFSPGKTRLQLSSATDATSKPWRTAVP